MIPRIFLCLLAVLAAVRAGDTAPVNPLDQAEVLLRVRDGRWVDREATRFAAAYGGDLAGVRSDLAHVLYWTNGFEGIDLGRPALLAWRTGKAPLLAAIPVTNRVAFLASFGVVGSNEPPLVRTGERDGAVIYKQNQPGGEWEYRLLIANNIAFLARTIDECRRLAAVIGTPAVDPFAPPVELQLRGDGVKSPRLPGADLFSLLPASPFGLGELTSVPGLLPGAWAGLAEQITAVSLTAQSDARGNLQLNARLAAKPDSALAGWINAQRPGTERLAGQLRRPGTAVLVTGRVSFQGQLERWVFDQVELVRVASGKHWTDAADGACRSLATLIERSGAFALAVERSGPSLLQTWVVEHPRAVEIVQAVAVLAGTLHGEEAQSAKVGERAAFSLASNGGSLCLAGDRHAVRVDDHGAKRGYELAADILARLEGPGGLDAAPSLLSLWADLALTWNAPPTAEGVPADPVIVAGAVRLLGAGQLGCTVEVQLAQLGKLLGRLNKTIRND